ncbi:MAG: hypothetical protein U1F66_04835 [bacterium]
MRLKEIGLAKSSLKHVAKPYGITTAVAGFISDFIKPGFNTPPYLLVVAALGFVATLVLFRKRAKAEGLESTFNSKLGGWLTFFSLSMVTWGAITLIFTATPEKGVTATVIPGVADLQARLLKIGEDVTEIKGTVGRIEEKIDQLSKSGTVIPHPQTPEEYFVNARFYEVKGNTGEALKAYEKFLELKPDYADVHAAYQTLMNNTQGLEATRQVYNSLQIRYPNDPIVALMAIRLFPDRNERLEKLRALAAKYPVLGPVQFELAQEYLSPGPGNVTIGEMKSAKTAFEQLKKAEEAGGLKGYYLDKVALEKVYQKRDEFEKMSTAFYGSMMAKPIVMSVEILPELVSLNIAPQEPKVQKIYYSIDAPNPTIDTGVSPYLKDPATGAGMPNTQVTGKIATGKHVLYAKYVNAQGKESPVSSFPFEVPPIQAQAQPDPGVLGDPRQNFTVIFQSIDGKSYEYFYSLDQPNLDQRTKGPSVALTGLGPGDHELHYYGVADGQKTEVYKLKLSQ